MEQKKNTGIKRIVLAFGYSWAGIKTAWQREAAFRQEAVACLLLLPLGFWLGDTGIERALLLSSVMLVPIVELLNSAIEAVVDRFGGEMHDLSGYAKDAGSAAVLLSIFLAVVVWVSILA